ncbi:hypothetical protein [Agrococcus carbonis]|uniref:Uncharacterized protein n=1 Tax=Agrococcus carbonis TaxID=684552 RepID=A0A1H1KV37_9MICO|nr:hypothetical protein [Agrococcus carbonis]SDR65655.1 hypothetical protein SAMN04489719_0100 [Agrococcus carbonis]
MSRRRSSGAALLAGAALVGAALLGGCAIPAPGAATPTPATAAPLSAAPSATAGPSPSAPAASAVLLEIVQLRGDVASGHIELRVTNETDAPLTVVRATYTSSRWSSPMVRDDDAEIPAGARRNLRLALPEPTCDRAPLEHLATLELADGTVIEGAPEDPLGQLDSLGADACELHDFETAVAEVAWLPPEIPLDGSGPAVLRLRFTPLAEPSPQRGTVEAILATPLLAPVDGSGARADPLPIGVELRRGDRPTVVEVPLEPGRCDLHAIAEDKQGTIFRVLGTMGGEPIELVLVSPVEQRDALLDWAVERCRALG